MMGEVMASMRISRNHNDAWLLQTATRLLTLHRTHVQMEATHVAKLYQKSAQVSVSDTAYATAAFFIDVGIDMLQPEQWNEYDLCLDLFSISAEAHRCALHLSKTKRQVLSI